MDDISLENMDKNMFDSTAGQILNLSTSDSRARIILWYFYKFDQKIGRCGVINPGNEYLAKHFNMSKEAVKIGICLAKKTGFLTTTGRGRTREFDFNQTLLRQKMLSHLQQKAAKKMTKNPVENPVENSSKNGANSEDFRTFCDTNCDTNCDTKKSGMTSVISGLNTNEKINEKIIDGKICEKIEMIFKSHNFDKFLNNVEFENVVNETMRLCDSLRSSHCEPTKVVSHDFSFSDNSNLEQMSIFNYLSNEANANTVPKGLDANAISVKLNQGDELSLFNGKVGVADVNVTEGVCSAPANHGDSTHTPAKIYAVASPEPREALCTIKDECLIVSGNNTPHSASHDLTQNPPLSKSSVSGIKSGERLRKRPASTSSVPFSTPVRADNLELKKRQTRGDYAEATNLLKQLQPLLGNFNITRSLATKTKNMIKIFTSEKILKAVDAYLNAKWVTDPNIYSFLSEETLGRFATIVEKPKESPYADYPDDRLPFQKEVDEGLINDGLMPSYMNKELAMKYGLYDLLYDENGNPHRYRDPHTPEHDQWLIDHVHERPSLLDYRDPEYKTIIYAPGSPEYEKRKRQIDKKNAHIAELRKIVGLEV